jgi:hypothetical protein
MTHREHISTEFSFELPLQQLAKESSDLNRMEVSGWGVWSFQISIDMMRLLLNNPHSWRQNVSKTGYNNIIFDFASASKRERSPRIVKSMLELYSQKLRRYLLPLTSYCGGQRKSSPTQMPPPRLSQAPYRTPRKASEGQLPK